MHCPCCGAPPHGAGDVLAFQDPISRDAAAVANLTQQAREAGSEMGAILRSLRDRLKAQQRASRLAERMVAEAYRSAVAALEDLLGRVPGPIAERLARLNVNVSALEYLLDGAGISRAESEVGRVLLDTLDLQRRALEAAGLPVERSINARALQAALTDVRERFWQGAIRGPSARLMLDGLRSSVSGETLSEAIARIGNRLERSLSRAATEARTTFAIFDRAIAAQAGAEAGAELYLYVGPRDGITRPFCGVLAGLVLDRAQVAALDNGQTAVAPLYAGGGYNCRHALSPVSAGLVERLGLPRATADDVVTANARAWRPGR